MTRSCLGAMTICLILCAACRGEALVRFDFTRPETAAAWRGTNDVGTLAAGAEGLVVPITGGDPNIIGPAMDLPAGQPLWLTIRYKSEDGGTLQVFYFEHGATELQSIRLGGKVGWNEVKAPLPPLGKGYRLRIDPPGASGKAILALVEIARRVPLQAPQWPAIDGAPIGGAGLRLENGEVALVHARNRLGRFDVHCGDALMARGVGTLPIGYLAGDEQKWVDLRSASAHAAAKGDGAIEAIATAKDADGATWRVRQEFARGRVAGTIDVMTEVSVDQDRQVVFLPMLVLSAGAGSFGEHKTQALFAGLEYLDKDEPSSSEADIIGPGAQRQVPNTLKITIPLMTVVAQDHYVALSWKMDDAIAAVFDSPDRIFKTGGTLMGLIAPGSDGFNRPQDSVIPHWPISMKAGGRMLLEATILAGRGQSAMESVSRYIAINPLPALPETMDLKAYVKTAAAGWLDSKIRAGDRYCHAWPGAFRPQPAADAAIYMRWLAESGADPALAARLKEASEGAIKQVESPLYNASAIGHIRWPLGSLIYGNVRQSVAQMRRSADKALGQFEPDGSIKYRSTKEWDFGKTHFAPDANGLTSNVVLQVLTAAAVSGDAKLKEEGLRLLRALNKFDNTAPRGAQTWEMPLHCPDIMGSAHLVRCYALGYQLAGDEQFLARARYWGWTGVPFIYLRDPAQKAVGPYATVPCLGATHWRGMNWMGLPVQWCGLVYAEALYRLADVDAQGPWKHLADGIVLSGIQQTWPADAPDRGGLLPDSYMLREEKRNDAAINPGTVQANAGRVYGPGRMYDFACLRDKGWMIHVPGEIRDPKPTAGGVTFSIRTWIKEPYWILISGCKTRPAVKVNGAATDSEWQEEGFIVVKAKGQATVEVKEQP